MEDFDLVFLDLEVGGVGSDSSGRVEVEAIEEDRDRDRVEVPSGMPFGA